jgi:hypothetical protein
MCSIIFCGIILIFMFRCRGAPCQSFFSVRFMSSLSFSEKLLFIPSFRGIPVMFDWGPCLVPGIHKITPSFQIAVSAAQQRCKTRRPSGNNREMLFCSGLRKIRIQGVRRRHLTGNKTSERVVEALELATVEGHHSQQSRVSLQKRVSFEIPVGSVLRVFSGSQMKDGETKCPSIAKDSRYHGDSCSAA